MSVQVDIVNETIEVQIIDDEVVNIAIWDGISVLQNGTVKASSVRTVDFVDGTNTTVVVTPEGNKAIVAVSSSGGGGGSGDVTGPSGATADNIATYNGPTGKIIKDGGSKISDLVPTSRTVNGQALSSNIVVPNILHYMRTGLYQTNAINASVTTLVSLAANSLRATPFIVVKSITIFSKDKIFLLIHPNKETNVFYLPAIKKRYLIAHTY